MEDYLPTQYCVGTKYKKIEILCLDKIFWLNFAICRLCPDAILRPDEIFSMDESGVTVKIDVRVNYEAHWKKKAHWTLLRHWHRHRHWQWLTSNDVKQIWSKHKKVALLCWFSYAICSFNLSKYPCYLYVWLITKTKKSNNFEKEQLIL